MCGHKRRVVKTIAFCNSTLAWGGGENWHLEAALYLAGQGYNVVMLAHERGALYERAKEHECSGFMVKPLSIGRLSFLNPVTVGGYVRFLKKYAIDTVIMNLPQDLKCMGLAAKMACIPRIIYRRGSALPVRNSMLNRYLYGRVITGLIVNSHATRSEVYRNNSRLIAEERVVVIANGIDIAAFEGRLAAAEPLPGFMGEGVADTGGLLGGALPSLKQGQAKDSAAKEAARQDHEGVFGALTPEIQKDTGKTVHSPRPVILGNAGRLNKQKGQQYLLYLARELELRGVDYRLVIAGSGERREELENLARNLGIAEKVLFCGFLDDTSPFWKTIDIFVLTSLWEGFGYVLLEAMLSAKPIVAFGVSNIPELVEDGKNGLLFPLPKEPDDPHGIPDMGAMAEAVHRLAGDASLRRRMGEAGRAFAKPAFDQEVVMGKLLSALEEGPLSA